MLGARKGGKITCLIHIVYHIPFDGAIFVSSHSWFWPLTHVVRKNAIYAGSGWNWAMVEGEFSSNTISYVLLLCLISRAPDSLELCVHTLPLMSSQSVALSRSSIPPTCRVKSCGLSLVSMRGVEHRHIPSERKWNLWCSDRQSRFLL
jgi:hypothetical protein